MKAAAIMLFVLAAAGIMVFMLLPDEPATGIDETPELRASLLSVADRGPTACPNPNLGPDCALVHIEMTVRNLGGPIDMSKLIVAYNTTQQAGNQEVARTPEDPILPENATITFTVDVVVTAGDRIQEVAFLDPAPFYASNGQQPATLLAKVELFDYTA